MEVFKRVISTSWLDLSGTYFNNSVPFVFYSIYNRHFLPQGGEPILPHLGCCGGFAVKYHSFTHRAYHLRQPRLVNNPG